MSISSEITRIQNKRDLSLQAVADKGVTVPAGSTIDDLPDLIDLIAVEPTYSVSKTLTNVTSSNDDTKVIAGNSFYADLAPTSGYAITSITVTMGGADVTEQVFQPGTGSKAITANGTYNASDDSLSGYDRVVVSVPPTQPDLGTKTITENGTYTASTDGIDGYSEVTVNVPTGSTPTGMKSISISANGTTTEDVTNYASAEITVNVPNSYTASDEGKVVSNGTLVSQISDTVTVNGTVDTTLINSLTVNVPTGGGSSVASGSFTPSANALSQTISDLAGTTLNHLFVKPTGNSRGPLGKSVRVVGPSFVDFTSGSECFFAVYSNASGGSFSAFASGVTSGASNFSFNRDTGTITTATGTGYFVAGVTYDWWAW